MGVNLLKFEKGISRLLSGKVVIPKNFKPQENEWWWVKIEERDRYAFAYQVCKHGNEEIIIANLPQCKKCNRPVAIHGSDEYKILYHRLTKDLKDKVGVAYENIYKKYGLCSDCLPKCKKCNSKLNDSTLCRIPAEYPFSDPQFCFECYPRTKLCEQCGNTVEYVKYTVPDDMPVAHFKCSKCGHRQSVDVGWRFVECKGWLRGGT